MKHVMTSDPALLLGTLVGFGVAALSFRTVCRMLRPTQEATRA